MPEKEPNQEQGDKKPKRSARSPYDKKFQPDRKKNNFSTGFPRKKKKDSGYSEKEAPKKSFNKGSDQFDKFKKRKPLKTNKPAFNEDFKGKNKEYKSDKKTFTKHIDRENAYEKVYSAVGSGKKESAYAEHSEIDISTSQMPLNKYIAHCGICSRREAVELIKKGKVEVNKKVVSEPGYKIQDEDVVSIEGKKITIQKNLVYVLMNKPKGYLTTTHDPKGRATVMNLLENHLEERIYPVGRLDRNTTGLLLLTNDGDLAQKLSHPKFEIRKIYQVKLDRNLSEEDFEKIKQGIVLEDGPIQVDQIAYLDLKDEVGLEIHSGRNRIVRRIFESLGYEVEKLDRVMYAGLTKKNLPRGKWRILNRQEVINLKHFKKN